MLMFKKNYRFKHTCNGDNEIGRRKQQKLPYHIFTCKFPISYITISRSADHDIVMMRIALLKYRWVYARNEAPKGADHRAPKDRGAEGADGWDS